MISVPRPRHVPVPKQLDPRRHAGALLRRTFSAPYVEQVPEGRLVELPGRGTTFVVDAPGPEGAPTVVLLHALGTTGYLSWYPVIAELTEHYRVVVFDQRWHGRGIRSRDFRLEDCADDTIALLDVLGIDQCIPVGYSMGGLIAQLVWQRHPERVEGLVLCATARNFRGGTLEQAWFTLMTSVLFPLRPMIRARQVRTAEALPDLPSAQAGEKGWGLQEFRSTSAWTMPAVLEALGRFNSAPWIGDVDVPTAVIIPTHDHTIPAERQRRLAAAIADAEVLEVEGGHTALVLKAAEFERALARALRSVTRRTRGLPQAG